jgi:hypothetical protein
MISPDPTRQEQASGVPVVFQFQPKVFQRLEGEDQLREWEQLLAKECGLHLAAPEGLEAPEGTLAPRLYKEWVRGESISGSGDDWDDCDYYP